MPQKEYKHPKQVLIQVSKKGLIGKYNPQKIIQKTTQQILLKIQKIMREYKQLNVAQFLRLFMFVLKKQIGPRQDFYMLYGLFKMFKQICRSYKTTKITFSQLSSFITQKMPVTDQDIIVKQKLLPLGLDIPQQQKIKMTLPSISGKVLTQRMFLNPVTALFDKYQHTNRCISQAFYSASNQIYFSVDLPSNFIRVSDNKFNQITKIQSELQISKKQSTIIYIAWSETEGRIGAILGNYSLSFWSKQDNYRFEVNIPLPNENLFNPYVILGFMESMSQWYVIDNRPVVFGLNSQNFQPAFQIKNFKMVKQRSTQKILTVEMKYQKLLCVAFERKIFLLSLKKKQVITELVNFKTSITSVVFSQTFQTLFVSNYDVFFQAYELTQHCDLTEKGKLQGHKHQIMLLGVVEKKPIVYSLQETGILKLWDIRDFTCYQTFSVLKNVRYLQILTVKQGVCLVGSKLYLYKWATNNRKSIILPKQNENEDETNLVRQKIILITTINKNILIVTNQSLKLYSHSNGNLLKAIRGLFRATQISFAFLNTAKKELYISDHQGNYLVLEIEEFTKIYEFKFLPHPVSMFYSQREDLVTMAAEKQIHIMRWKRQDNFDLKRRIFNENQNLKICKNFSLHDLVTAVYENQNQNQQESILKQKKNPGKSTIFFYTFERGKAIGLMSVENLVDFQIHKQKNILQVLEKNCLKIYSFKKSTISLTFELHYQIKLWSQETLQATLTPQFIEYLQNVKGTISSQGIHLFEDSIVVVSNFSCLFCSIEINQEKVSPDSIQKMDPNYNPYRISVESHKEAFAQFKKQSEIIDRTDENLHFVIKYKRTKAFAKSLHSVQLGNLIGIYNSKMDLHFFDHSSHSLVGVINSQLTLPKIWDFSFYEEAQLDDIDFVLDYMQNEEKKKTQTQRLNQIFTLTLNENLNQLSPQKRKPSPLTIERILKFSQGLIPLKQTANPSINNYSLRERKLMLEKQRQQKRRLQNFLQHQQQEELNKLRSYHSQDAQSNINEVLNFFALNRNEMVKYKGITQTQIPQQVKLLQKKLQNSLKPLQRKNSIFQTTFGSKNSTLIKLSELRGQKEKMMKMRSTDKKQGIPINLSSEERIFKKIGSIKYLEQSLQKVSNESPYKKLGGGNISEKRILLRVLDEQVRRSKLSTKNTMSTNRNSSLPVLKKFYN